MPHELVARLLSELAAARATIAASYDRLWPSSSEAGDAEARDETALGRDCEPPPTAEEPEAR
jgi:hypothetical protein